MSQSVAHEDVVRVLRSFSRALHPRELASRLGVAPDDYAHLIALLDRLEQEGRLKTLPGGRVRWDDRGAHVPAASGRRGRNQAERGDKKSATPRDPAQSWTGAISVNARGFAFVTSPGKDDVFIPPDGIYEAMHGDTVRVRIMGRSPKGLEGVVDGVEQRRDPRVAGVIHKQRKACWLEPDDSRIRSPITLLGDTSHCKDGDAAIAIIQRFPLYSEELPEAEIAEILGPSGDPQTEVRKILIREGVVEEHSPEALKNAEQMAARLGSIRLGKRVDLRHVPLPTIDPEDARDHDDAVWVERLGKGYKVYVAIADVSEYVRAESPLDEEARARGCTIYLPDRAIPMLPRALAGDLCSLLPEQDRYCLCVIAELDINGGTQKFEIVEAVMRSAAKLTYGGVARTLGFDEESPQSPAAEAFKSDLFVLAEVASKLRQNRMQRGALDLDLPEARVVIDDETGSPVEVKKRATRAGLKRAYNLIEELMLLANELVADWLTERNIPAIYRVHDRPDQEKLDRLAKITDQLAVQVDVDALDEPRGVSQFLSDIAGHEKQPVLEMLLLRSLKQAVYDIDNIGHFGLASPRYLHFTSPIRRYPDLRVHRQIKQILRGGKVDGSDEARDDLRAAAMESSKKERAAMEIEREVLNLYRALYMKNHIDERFSARVTGLSSAGLYASIDTPCVDVMIPYEALGADQFELDEDELGVIGKRSKEHIMLGDELNVEIRDISLVRRTVYATRLTADSQTQRGERDWDPPSYSFADGGGRPGTPAAFPPRPGARKTFRSQATGSRPTRTSGTGARSFKSQAGSGEDASARKDSPSSARRSSSATRSGPGARPASATRSAPSARAGANARSPSQGSDKAGKRKGPGEGRANREQASGPKKTGQRGGAKRRR